MYIPDQQERYWLLPGLCAIPQQFYKDSDSSEEAERSRKSKGARRGTVREFAEVTRVVCRRLCSTTYNLSCSGFLYFRENRSCTLSPYTGRWLPSDHPSCDPLIQRIEFYRRERSLGLNTIIYFTVAVVNG